MAATLPSAEKPAPSTSYTPSPDPRPLVRLRTGTLVRPRGDGLIQVGGDPTRAAALPDTTGVRGLLHLLEGGVRVEQDEGVRPLLDALGRAGVLVDQDEQQLLSGARGCTRVAVAAPPPWDETGQGLVRAAGFEVVPADDEADLVLAVRVLGRSAAPADGTGRALVLHVDVVDARVCVGPFVSWGDTACEGCLELHRREADPWHVPAHPPGARRTGARNPGEDGAADGATDLDADPTLVGLALSSAVLDLAAWTEGREPLSWSTTRWFDASQRVEQQRWSPHPACSCAWEDAGTWRRDPGRRDAGQRDVGRTSPGAC